MEQLKQHLAGFDLEDALDRFSGSQETLLKYIQLMANDFHARLPGVRTLLDAGDFDSAARCLHALSGSAAALSAQYLLSLCRECEASLAAQGIEQALEYLHQMDTYLELLTGQAPDGR